MLNKLTISNLAVIDKQELKLSDGLTVLTGETGAGKSVLIDSINMILGHRCDKTLVRYGKKAAVAEAVFDANEKAVKMLEDEGIFDCDDGVCVSRSLSSEGKSACRINAVSVSASFLKTMGAELVNIHGQQDNQKLLLKKYHTDILDDYIRLNGGGQIIDEYRAVYEKYARSKAELDKLEENQKEIQKEINYLTFIADELDEADIYEGEEKELCEKQEVLANAKEIYTNLMETCDLLYDGEENAYSYISRAIRLLSKISTYSPELERICDELNECMYQIKDLTSDARSFCDGCDTDEQQLAQTDDRLSLIFDLKRKYKKKADELVSYRTEVREKLESLTECDPESVRKITNELFERAEKCAKKLSEMRLEYKKVLEDKIYAALCDLNMKNAKFEIALTANALAVHGAESAEFLMCTSGQGEMRAMEKIASGGELSRIMLAIKYVLANADDCETLIFDEIDTGVSGVSAQAVAEKLYALSKTKQVICITHLPQIAAMADNHVFISKTEGEDKMFYTTVKTLEKDERAEEIARIIGGRGENETVIKAAEDMLESAECVKKQIRSM